MTNIVYCFLMIWGLIFGGVPLGLFIGGVATLENEPFLLIFVAIGLVVFSIGFRFLLKNFRYRKIKKIGTKTIGVFIDRACGLTVNGTPMYYIKFSFVNDSGESIEIKTPSVYTVRQSEFYEKIGRFEVKFVNNVAVISQPVDYRLLEKIEYSGEDASDRVDIKPVVKQGYYRCDYCGNEQEKTGKCKSCGAKVTSKNFRETN